MFGATLRINYPMADLCRDNIGLSTLVLDTNHWFIEAMFIDCDEIDPPSAGGLCL